MEFRFLVSNLACEALGKSAICLSARPVLLPGHCVGQFGHKCGLYRSLAGGGGRSLSPDWKALNCANDLVRHIGFFKVSHILAGQIDHKRGDGIFNM